MLRDAGCDVTVLTGQPNYPDGEIYKGYSSYSIFKQLYEGIEVFRVPIIPRGPGSGFWLILNYISFIISAAIFGPWLLRRLSFDAILVFAPSPILQTIPAIFLARIKKAYLITWIQDLWPESLSATGFIKNIWLLELVSKLVRWIYRKNDCLLVQSEAFIDPVTKMAGKTPVFYHPNPGELAFSLTPNSVSPIKMCSGFNVVFTGNLGTVQALETILKAAALLQDEDIFFFLVGSGSRLDWIKGEISRLGLKNIHLTGRLPLSEMPAIMRQASALLVSLGRNPILSQTIPSKMQAYFSAGKPIIASLDGEGARVVSIAGAGVTCPAESPEALAAAVKVLRDMPEKKRIQMGENAIQFYRDNFEPRMLTNRLVNLLLQAKQGLK